MFIRTCLGARLLPLSVPTLRASLSGTFLQRKDVVNQCLKFDQYPNLSEGADHVGGQLRGNKECPFSGVTKSGRVWRKVPESDARSVVQSLSGRQRRQDGGRWYAWRISQMLDRSFSCHRNYPPPSPCILFLS